MVRWLISAAILATAAHANRPAHDRVAIPAGPFTAGEHARRRRRAPGAQGDRQGVRHRSHRGHPRRLRRLRGRRSLQGDRRRRPPPTVPRPSSRHRRRLERRAGLLQVRGRPASVGGRMGEGGARDRRARVPVGQRHRLRARELGELRGRRSVRRQEPGPSGRRRTVPDGRQPLWPARHGGQRLGVGGGQVRRRSRPARRARRLLLQLLRRAARRQPERLGPRAPRRRSRVPLRRRRNDDGDDDRRDP